MNRRQRIPGSRSSVCWRLEVATGVDPTRALVRVLRELPFGRGEVWSVGVRHDDGCPAIDSGPMNVCTCEIVEFEARKSA